MKNPRKPTGLVKHHSYVKPGIKGRLNLAKHGVDYFVGEEELMAYGRRCGRLKLAVSSSVRISASYRPPTAPSIPYNPEQARMATDVIPEHPEQRERAHPSDENEEKCENNEVYTPGAVDLDVFDEENFMEGLKNENLFGPVDKDDVNLLDAPDESNSESDADNEDVMADNAVPVIVDGVEDLGEVPIDAEAPNYGMFGMTKKHCAVLVIQVGLYTMKHTVVRELQLPAALDYYNGPWGPTRSAVAYSDSPLAMFFYFLPKALWIRIADETNRYREQNIGALHAGPNRTKLLARQAKDPRVSVPNLEDMEQDLNKFKRIQPYEIVHVIALLFARAIAPIRDGLAKHWATEEDGAIPRGTFSRFMKRGRFEAIMQFLHFNDNSESGAHLDKAWKERPTFRRGYRKVISFDEGMMPNRSKYNPVRVFMPDKPSKYGTKFYMTCCAETAYCSRVEIYCGAEKQTKKKKTTPEVTLSVGPKAVVRNITKALFGQPPKRLIVTDSFYSTVALSLKLLKMKLYHVGTTRIDRLGWCPIQFTQSKRPKRMARGTYRIAQCRDHPELVALSWMDSKPVNMIATGCSTQVSSVERTEKDGSRSVVPCPQLVVDYGKGMGGVDVHDQLRLQRYSIQKCISLRKYYKQLFLCIVDMAVVNEYVVHRTTLEKKEKLHLHMQTIYAACTIKDVVSVPIPPQEHKLVNTDEFYTKGKQNKRRQYLCKVCSAFADSKAKSFETSFFCIHCSDAFGGRVPLCRHTRRVDSGNTLTCAQIWHETWNNGTQIPPNLKKKIRFRKRKRDENDDA
ncbi:LOW QUALITY PROTEIN: hypothetical protein PHMEG_00021815 [Phytophthora megakarya]|uniref:PiggyBac transposable element-derived protein domain-containing protein n=1 Tax=Phytophthora megakarya TaxID=4795 RepID=A0A225VKX7_9STRA|nr:LOW QUALITY PROTEIN: hypothetical protein PHMEG_00021815 [Phytophthora megakarya]